MVRHDCAVGRVPKGHELRSNLFHALNDRLCSGDCARKDTWSVTWLTEAEIRSSKEVDNVQFTNKRCQGGKASRNDRSRLELREMLLFRLSSVESSVTARASDCETTSRKSSNSSLFWEAASERGNITSKMEARESKPPVCMALCSKVGCSCHSHPFGVDTTS